MGYIKKSNQVVQALRAVDENVIDVYRPTNLKIARWFNILNREVFLGKLPKFKVVKVKKIKDAWAECAGEFDKNDDPFCNLTMTNIFPNRSEFLHALAHEMVHFYQWIYNDEMTHGKSFFDWEARFKKFELRLAIKGKYRFKKLFSLRRFCAKLRF